jgi:hypothetical protein
LLGMGSNEGDSCFTTMTTGSSEAAMAGCFKALAEINKATYSFKNNGNYRLTLEVLFMNLRKIEQNERGGNPND